MYLLFQGSIPLIEKDYDLCKIIYSDIKVMTLKHDAGVVMMDNDNHIKYKL